MNILLPNIAHAQTVDSIIHGIARNIFDPLIGILFALALVFFLWGIVMFIFQADDDNARTQGKSHMVWGLVGMFIMVSVYGILRLITSAFGLPPIV